MSSLRLENLRVRSCASEESGQGSGLLGVGQVHLPSAPHPGGCWAQGTPARRSPETLLDRGSSFLWCSTPKTCLLGLRRDIIIVGSWAESERGCPYLGGSVMARDLSVSSWRRHTRAGTQSSEPDVLQGKSGQARAAGENGKRQGEGRMLASTCAAGEPPPPCWLAPRPR